MVIKRGLRESGDGDAESWRDWVQKTTIGYIVCSKEPEVHFLSSQLLVYSALTLVPSIRKFITRISGNQRIVSEEAEEAASELEAEEPENEK